MTNDPWTDPDPAPGDFDADLATIAPQLVESRDGNAIAVLRIVVSVQGEDAWLLRKASVERAGMDTRGQVNAGLGADRKLRASGGSFVVTESLPRSGSRARAVPVRRRLR
jgi:hypothetical protein